MRIVPIAVLAATIAVSSIAPSFAQSSVFRPPGSGFHGGGAGGGNFHGGGGSVNRFGGPGGGRQIGNGPRPDGRRFGGGSGGYRHRGYGAAVGAGVAGLAAGALIGGAIANQGYYGDPGYGYGVQGYGDPDDDRGVVVADQDDVAPAGADGADYCAQRYRSYDRASGTYLGFDGYRHSCP